MSACECQGEGSLEQPLVKRPAESRMYDIDFQHLLASGLALASVTSVIADLVSGSGSLSVSATSVNGTRGQARLSGGDAGSLYRVTYRVVDNAASPNTLEECLFVRVETC